MARKSFKNHASINGGPSALARLLAGISTGSAALILAAAPTGVRAQAVVGTPTIQFGIETVIRDSATKTDTVLVTADEALLDWDATGTDGVFLPESTTLQFIRDGGAYTVLNRVTSSAVGGPLSISGTVDAGSTGKVWFYNPGGWVVGSTGVFNVGSLVLTSLPIAVDPATDTVSRLYGDKGEIRFGKALDPASSVTIGAGAQINANLATSSYVALVAPKVVQGGTVTVDGSTAYVAAEAATMTINNGLFDIVVDSGTDDSTGIAHTGTTTGPAGSLSDPNHRIYLVAVPKNQAMTAVVSGSLGYVPAVVASSESDGSIVLSAGYNVVGGNAASDSPVAGNASLLVTGLDASNDIAGAATGAITVDAKTSSVALAGNAYLTARGDIAMSVAGDNFLTVGKTLDARSANGASAGNVSLTVAGGGLVTVGGDLALASVAKGAVLLDPSNGDAFLPGGLGEDAAAGNVSVSITDGTLAVTGASSLTSQATGGVGELGAGKATSGSVSFVAKQTDGALSAYSLSLGNVTLASTADSASFAGPQVPLAGASSVSGNAGLAVDGGQFSAGILDVSSSAIASVGQDLAPQAASAGAASVAFANGVETFSLQSLGVSNYASAASGGGASTGDVGLSLDNVAVTVSNGSGFGFASISSSSDGGLALPAKLTLSLVNGSILDTGSGYVDIYASGYGATALQRASDIDILVDNSTLTTGGLYASSSASGSGSGVNAFGGDVSLVVRNAATLSTIYSVSLGSYGNGGSGVDAGDGTGGDVSLLLDDATMRVGNFYVQSEGSAGSRSDAAGRAGTGYGGNASFRQTGSNATFTASFATVSSVGGGGGGESALSDISTLSSGFQAGDGSDAYGGTAAFSVEGGTFDAASINVSAEGQGGSGLNVAGFGPARGGAGHGGTATFSISGGTVSASTVDVSASGLGGRGADQDATLGIAGGKGGSGFGGIATIDLTGGTLSSDKVTLSANGNKSVDYGSGFIGYQGTGGDLFYADGAAGAGGDGFGGTAIFTVDGGALLDAVDAGSLALAVSVQAIGEGGAGGQFYDDGSFVGASGSGGSGTGGTARLRFLSGQLDATSLGVDASGLGGPAGNSRAGSSSGGVASLAGSGGSGTGGAASLDLGASFGAAAISGATRSIAVRADGIGQNGESGIAAGSGGSGTGGTAGVTVTGGSVSLSSITLSALGSGGAGGDSQADNNGGLGGNGAGGAANVSASGSGTSLVLTDASILVGGAGGRGGAGGNGRADLDAAGNGGAGGSGKGGSINLTASDLGSLTLEALSGVNSLSASGLGGAGGLAGNAAAFGFSTVGDGGAGGAGSGGAIVGTAQSGGAISLGFLSLSALGQGGDGGSHADFSSDTPPEASVGGAGGSGAGGTISLTSTGSGSRLAADTLSASVNGAGGNGVAGYGTVIATGDGAAGSVGGQGSGGSISLIASASGTLSLAATDGSVDLSANGLGGLGGAGATGEFGSGGNGGNGGAGGIGAGGSVSILSATGGSAQLGLAGLVTVAANGTGGLGGTGGNGASNFSSDPLALGGSGGDNGLGNAGVGGSVALGAEGGSLTLGGLAIEARGATNYNTNFSSPGSGPGGSGNFGGRSYADPSGGSISIGSSNDAGGGTGSLIAGSTSLDVTSSLVFQTANGAFASPSLAGTIQIENASSRSSDGLHFASLSANASGNGGNGAGIAMRALAGPIQVTGDLQLDAATLVTIDTTGSAGVVVGGNASINSAGAIAITGDSGGQLLATNISLVSSGATDIASIGCLTPSCSPVHASGTFNAFAADFNLLGPAVVTGLGGLDVYAFGNITGGAGSGYFSNDDLQVRGSGNVTVRNASGRAVNLEAGAIVDGSTFYYEGTLTLGEDAGGGSIAASGPLSAASGGNIVVTGGNTISAAAGMTFLSGNDIAIGSGNAISANTDGTFDPQPVVFSAGGLAINYDLAAGDIATLSFGDGTSVVANLGDIYLSGAAVDARGASFTGGAFYADVTRSLALGDPRGDDGGTLAADCLEGAICLGNVEVTGGLNVGQGDFVPVEVRAAGSLSGASVSISALGDVTVGQIESGGQVFATGTAAITSSSGSIALLGNSVVTGGTVALTGAGSLTGTGTIIATTDDVGLSFGGDIDAGAVTAARELTTAPLAGGLAEGSFATPGALRVGALSLGAAAVIEAGTDLVVGQLSLPGADASLSAGALLSLQQTSGVRNLALAAPTVSFGALAIDGNLSITGVSVSGDSIEAGGTIGIAAGDLTAALLEAAGDVTLSVTGTAALGTVTSTGGAVTIDPVLLTFDAIEAAGAVSLSGGTITGGTVVAGTSLAATASGVLTLASATSGTSLTLSGATIGAGALAAGGDLALAASGAVTLTGAASAGGAFSADAGSLAFTAVDAVGTLSITSANGTSGVDLSGASILIEDGGDIAFGTAVAGSGGFAASGRSIAFDAVRSGSTASFAASGAVVGGSVVAADQIAVTAGGGLDYASLDGSSIGIVAASVDGGAVTARTGDINISASGAVGLGALNAPGYVGIDAGALTFSTIVAGNGFGTTNSGMTGTSIQSGGDVSISTDGDVTLSALGGVAVYVRSGGVVNIAGLEASDLVSVSADAVGLTAIGALQIGSIFASGGNVDVTASGSITGNRIDALGDIAMQSTGGNVTIANLSAGYGNVFGGSVRPQGTVASGVVGLGDIRLVAAGFVQVDAVADAANAFVTNAGGAIRINGLATGKTMTLASSDLVIGQTGQLGESTHTDAIALSNTGTGVTLLGDNIPTQTSGYAISQADFDRIRSRGNLAISGTTAMLVGDLAVTAQAGQTGGQIGETGTLSLQSNGLLSFLGGVSVANATGNTLAVMGGQGVFLDAETGSIRLLEGQQRAGSLEVAGSGIAMVTRDALADIAATTDTAFITDRLGQNDGVADGRTLVEAGNVTLRSDREVYIQNTSSSTRIPERRGLVADGLSIGSRDGTVLDIVINGIVNGASGTDAIEQIAFEDAFTDLSSVNGCVINSANSCNKVPFDAIEVRDLIEEVLRDDPEDNALQIVDSFTKTTLIQLNQIAPAGFEPLIDEPVTGTGNDDLLGDEEGE